MNPSIALCMIVKNEAPGLGRAIASAASWVDDILVVDTGSTDGTVELARQAGATVHHFEFTNGVDLGAARTRSIELARTDWALLLDGDTELDASSGPLLREAARRNSNPPRTVGAVWRNYSGAGANYYEAFTRTLIPLAPGRRLLGRRHEYYVDADGAMLPTAVAPEIVVHHWGFTGQNLARKRTGEDSAALALRQLKNTPQYSVFWLDAIRAHMEEDACATGLALIGRFKRALAAGEVPHRVEGTEFQMHYLSALLAFEAEGFDQARDSAGAALAIAPSRDMLALRAAVKAKAGDDVAACRDLEKADKLGSSPHLLTGCAQGSHVSSKMLCFVAEAAERSGRTRQAMEWYARAMSTVPTYLPGPLIFARFLARSGQVDSAAALLCEALNAMPENGEFASLLLDCWRQSRARALPDLVVKARARWPANQVLAAWRVSLVIKNTDFEYVVRGPRT